MIQRVQSIYFALSGIFLLLLFAFPVFDIIPDPDTTEHFMLKDEILPLISVVVAALLNLAAIALYSNRPLQIKLGNGALIVNILVIALLSYHIYVNNTAPDGRIIEYKLTGLLPLLSLVTTFLAIRGVKADEALVRSMDRLR